MQRVYPSYRKFSYILCVYSDDVCFIKKGVKMEELLEKYLKIVKDFNELYKGGLIGVGQNSLQIELKEFKKLFGDITKIKIEKAFLEGYKLSVELEGISIFALV
jgi:hypothetical protein